MTRIRSQLPKHSLFSVSRRSILPASAVAVGVALVACAQGASPGSQDATPVLATQSSALVADTALDTVAVDAQVCCPTWSDVCDLLEADDSAANSGFFAVAAAPVLTSVSSGAAEPLGVVAAGPPTIRRCWDALCRFFGKVDVDPATGKAIDQCEIPLWVQQQIFTPKQREKLACITAESPTGRELLRLWKELSKLQEAALAISQKIDGLLKQEAAKLKEITKLELDLSKLASDDPERAALENQLQAARKVVEELDVAIKEAYRSLGKNQDAQKDLNKQVRGKIDECEVPVKPVD